MFAVGSLALCQSGSGACEIWICAESRDAVSAGFEHGNAGVSLASPILMEINFLEENGIHTWC